MPPMLVQIALAVVDVPRFASIRPSPTRFSGAPRKLAEALERMDLCIALKEVQADSLKGFLSRNP
jgi:hypothetical protein